MRFSKTLDLIILSTLLAGVGCVKKRPVEYSQGQGVDAQAIGSIDKQRYSLDTRGEIKSTTKTMSLTKVEISDDLDGVINQFPLVEYTTDSELLGKDLPIRGKSNTHYEIRYELTDSFLRVLKVAKKENLPVEEMPYAIPLEDAKFGVPIVGYPVRYFKIDYAVNDDNARTSRLIELPVADRAQATHFRIERTGRKVFEAIQTIDTYPAAYFQGEWFYKETVTDVSVGAEDMLGQERAFDSTFADAGRIRIGVNKKSLVGVNMNRDERLSPDDVLNQSNVFTVPVEWKDFRAERLGRGPGLREEENVDSEETKRPYVSIKFADIVSAGNIQSELEQVFSKALGQLLGIQQLVDLKFTKNFFSFTVLRSGASSGGRGTTTQKVRYAFLRSDPTSPLTPPRPFSERDSRTFGYFVTYKNFEWDRNIQRKADVEAKQFMSRFNPAVKEIVYRFSRGTPRADQPYGWVREVGRNAVNFWDQAFQMAGTGIHVRLDETDDADLGDLRYNVLNITNPLLAGGLLGYGPSLADTRNGQILAATTNIQMTGFVAGFSSEIRKYMRDQLGQSADNLTGAPFISAGAKVNGQGFAAQSAGLAGLAGVQLIDVANDGTAKRKPFEYYAYDDLAGKQLVKRSLSLMYSDEAVKEQLEAYSDGTSIHSPTEAIDRYHEILDSGILPPRLKFLQDSISPFTAGTEKYTAKRIQQLCPEIDQYVEKIKGDGGKIQTAQEIPIIEGCVQKLIRLPTLHTILHEMGHNFSLRHNFTCSNDKGNFWTADEIRAKFKGLNGAAFPEEFLPFGQDPTGSCVMDYMSDYGSQLPVPGKYDIAAIRFIYTDKVELTNGELVSTSTEIDGKKQYSAIADLTDQSLKKFKFCTDEDVSRSNNPMCLRFDDGVTPEEIVDRYIEQYWNSLVNNNYRYGRQYPLSLTTMAIFGRLTILGQLKRFYDEWRFHVAEFTGQKDEYLERFDDAPYKKVLEQMSKSSLAAEYAQYKPVRDKILNFLVNVAYLPNRYCVGKNQMGRTIAIEFSKLQGELALIERGAYAANCQAPGIQKLLAQKQISFIAEIGHNLEVTRFSTAIEDLKEFPDTWGTEPDRLMAQDMLTARMQSSQLHQTRNFFPAMIDEPDVRAIVIGAYMNRILGGLNISEELSKIPALAGNPENKRPQVIYQAESQLLGLFASSIKQGLKIPGKVESNQKRSALFSIDSTRQGTDHFNAVSKQGAVFLPDASGALLFALPGNQFSYTLIKRIQTARDERALAQADLNSEEVKSILGALVGLFPPDGETKFTAKALAQVTSTFAQLVTSNNKVSEGTKMIAGKIVAPYLQVSAGIGLDQALTQIQDTANKEAQAKDSLKQAGALDQAPADPKTESDQIQALRKQIADGEAAQASFMNQLESTDVGALIAANPAAGLKIPLNQKDFIAAANAVIGSIVQLRDFDSQEYDAHVDLLIRVLESN